MSTTAKQWGGTRPGAGPPHKHQEYILVEVVDFYGEKDALIAGMLKDTYAMQRAHRIAAHHVNEQARSVKIVKRLCCSHEESTVIEIIK
jgi:hypothetical protein